MAAPRVVWMPGHVRTEIHLTARDTDGAFCLLVDHPPAGWSLPAHLHHGYAETIHIIEGEFEIRIDGERSLLHAGETAHIPSDVVHEGGNLGTTTGQRIVIFSPAGMETFFLEVGTPAEHLEIDITTALAAATRHGWQFIT
jgi:quercetin dioxygenase-like cupin family protein